MAHKIHLRQTTGGKTACNSRYIGNGKFVYNSRVAMGFIPFDNIVRPDVFRATLAADRCAHCSDKFLETMNRRRKASGKPIYINAWTREIAT